MTPGSGPRADRTSDFDLYRLEVRDGDYQMALKRALLAPRLASPFWSRANGGHWIVTESEQIQKVLSDFAHFSSRQVSIPVQSDDAVPIKPLTSDPPNHRKYRDILSGVFAPKNVERLAVDVRELAIELIEGFRVRGACEFMSEFARVLPIRIFLRLVDLPDSDKARLLDAAEQGIRGETEEERVEGRNRIAEYARERVAERRLGDGADLISLIARAEIDGKPISDVEAVGMVTLLLFAGLDTVVSTLGFFAFFLARHPRSRAALLADPALVNNAVEELLRRYSVSVLARQVCADVDLGGVILRLGEMVMAPIPLDGLDDGKYPDAASVDFSRKVTNHASFGSGVHRCLGSMLARTELRIFLEEWLRRIPDFEIEPGAVIAVTASSVSTIDSLPLVWTVEQLG